MQLHHKSPNLLPNLPVSAHKLKETSELPNSRQDVSQMYTQNCEDVRLMWLSEKFRLYKNLLSILAKTPYGIFGLCREEKTDFEFVDSAIKREVLTDVVAEKNPSESSPKALRNSCTTDLTVSEELLNNFTSDFANKHSKFNSPNDSGQPKHKRSDLKLLAVRVHDVVRTIKNTTKKDLADYLAMQIEVSSISPFSILIIESQVKDKILSEESMMLLIYLLL